MASGPANFNLSLDELREVVAFAVACGRPALPIFDRTLPDDLRPSAALDHAQAFADGASRTRALRDAAWSAQHAARDARAAGKLAASEAAYAALAAAGAGYLHPVPKATQTKHILGAAGHAARALELAADDPAVGDGHIVAVRALASPVLADVLRRYPPSPATRSRTNQLMHALEVSLR